MNIQNVSMASNISYANKSNMENPSFSGLNKVGGFVSSTKSLKPNPQSLGLRIKILFKKMLGLYDVTKSVKEGEECVVVGKHFAPFNLTVPYGNILIKKGAKVNGTYCAKNGFIEIYGKLKGGKLESQQGVIAKDGSKLEGEISSIDGDAMIDGDILKKGLKVNVGGHVDFSHGMKSILNGKEATSKGPLLINSYKGIVSISRDLPNGSVVEGSDVRLTKYAKMDKVKIHSSGKLVCESEITPNTELQSPDLRPDNSPTPEEQKKNIEEMRKHIQEHFEDYTQIPGPKPKALLE